MNTKLIVLAGGPGTGKSTCIKELQKRGYMCFDEVSREITNKAQQEGISQLFLEDPLLFSQKLLEGRAKQYVEAQNSNQEFAFIDRGVHDIVAYLDYKGDTYPDYFMQACHTYTYSKVFMLPPWESIFITDTERYENFEEAKQIHQYLTKTYHKFNYSPTIVPFESVENRVNFILNQLNILD